MPMAMIRAYLDRIIAMQGEAKANESEVIMLPHIEKRDRIKILRRWERQSGARGEARPASAAALRRMGIGVEFVQ
jgi:hypothetical protein